MSDQLPQGFIDECEREALHLVGAIQPYGVLLGGRAGDERIRHVSANVEDWLGFEPASLLGKPLTDLLPGFPPGDKTAAPVSGSSKPKQWMYPSTEKQLFPGLFEGPAGALDGWLSCNSHTWLLELETALPETQRVGAYRPIPHRLFRPPNSDSDWRNYCQFLADTVREATGFERVMIYRFRDDGSGEVITESLVAGLDPYLGLRYPASDIPQIARELYLANSHRQIPDRAAQSVPILSAAAQSADGAEAEVDLTLADLRAVSQVHLEYLKNMAVTASLSFSLVVSERLWGLVACHHSSPRCLPLPVRERCVAMCQAFALAISGFQGTRRLLEISESEEDITRLHEVLRRADECYPDDASASTVPQLGDLLLQLVNASGAALVDGQSVIRFGRAPSAEAIVAQVAWLQAETTDQVFSTDHLPDLYPPARADAGIASGLMAVRVTHFGEEGERVFLWWRPEQPQTVTWAGDPRKSALSDRGHEMLSPRSSFESWVETTTGHSDPWSVPDLLRARKFRSLLLRDINADLLSP